MVRISGRVIAAARALAGVSQEAFAQECGLPVDHLCRLESSGSAFITDEADVEAALRGMGYFGVVVVEETEDMGAGVRLKFTRADVKQIVRLETEGGVTAADDAP